MNAVTLRARLRVCCFAIPVAVLMLDMDGRRGRAEDWGYSHNFFIKKKISDRWAVESRSLFTSRDNMREIFLGVADIGLSYDVTGWLNIGAAYRAGWILVNGEYGYENRPLINLTLRGKWEGALISNRSRVEFRHYDFDRRDDVRFRNETRIIFPWELPMGRLRPYMEEEFFYADNAGEINMNWLTAGLTCRLNEHVRVKSGYRWNTFKFGPEWEHRHMWVTGFAFLF